jgi:hypothetical protein
MNPLDSSHLCCIEQYCGELFRHGGCVIDKKKESRGFGAIYSAVMNEMAEPRLAASVRDRIMKFKVADLLHNRDTDEDGRVIRINANNGVITYEVWVPKDGDSWKGGYFISHWRESVLESYSNTRLRSSGKKLRRTLDFMSLHVDVGKSRFPEI